MENDNREIMDLLKKWQKILKLEHWEIILKIVRRSELECPIHDYGNVSFGPTMERAVLKLCRVDDIQEDFPYDLEIVLVHELLHLIFGCWVELTETQDGLMERAIERIAITLVSLERLEHKKEEMKDEQALMRERKYMYKDEQRERKEREYREKEYRQEGENDN